MTVLQFVQPLARASFKRHMDGVDTVPRPAIIGRVGESWSYLAPTEEPSTTS